MQRSEERDLKRVAPETALGPDVRRLNPTLERLTVPVLLLFGLAVSLRPGFENDGWWHVASGRWMLENQSWLTVDVFSWPRHGAPWPRPGLVADVGMAWLYSWGGGPLLAVAVSLCFVAAIAILLTATEAEPPAKLAVGLAAISAMAIAAQPRPLVASLTFTALSVVVLERERRSAAGTSWLWSLPLISAAWVNTHGAFVVLFLLLGCHGLAHLWHLFRREGETEPNGWGKRSNLSRLLIVGLLSIAAVAANPFGLKMLAYPVETVQLEVTDSIVEWERAIPTNSVSWPFYVLVAASLVAVVRPRQERRTVDAIVLAVFGALAFSALRHGPIFAIVAFPIVARLLSRRSESRVTREAWLGAGNRERSIEGGLLAVIAALVFALVSPALTTSGHERAIAELHGDRAVRHAASGELPGRLWTSYDLGGHVIWRGYPDVLVSMDSRADLYGDELVRENFAEWEGRRDAPSRFLERGIGAALVEVQAPLARQLEAAGWDRVVQDDVAVILVAPD